MAIRNWMEDTNGSEISAMKGPAGSRPGPGRGLPAVWPADQPVNCVTCPAVITPSWTS